MGFARFRKWLCLLATGSCLLQAAGGCPDMGDIRQTATKSVESFVTGVADMYIKAGINSAMAD
jgi:hypothetical protein